MIRGRNWCRDHCRWRNAIFPNHSGPHPNGGRKVRRRFPQRVLATHFSLFVNRLQYWHRLWRNRGLETVALAAVLDLPHEEFLSWLQSQQQPPLRARQIRRWIITGRAESFEQMTDLPSELRRSLAAEFLPLGSRIEQHQA